MFGPVPNKHFNCTVGHIETGLVKNVWAMPNKHLKWSKRLGREPPLGLISPEILCKWTR